MKSVHIGALGDAGIKDKNNVSTWMDFFLRRDGEEETAVTR